MAGEGGDGGGQVSEGQALIGGESSDSDDDGDGEGSSIDRLTERMDRFLSTIEEDDDGDQAWFDYLDGDSDDDYDDEEDDEEDDDLDDLSEEERQAREILQQFVDERLRDQIEPVVEAQREERRMQQLESLEEKYPELQTREGAAPVLMMAERLAQALGEPGLAYEAPFLETAYLRMKAEGMVAAEDAADDGGGSETPLEQGGSASAGGSGEVDLAEEIVKAGKGRSYLIGG